MAQSLLNGQPMKSYHITCRAKKLGIPLNSREHYLLLWTELRKRLNRCLAICLMPDHVHLLAHEFDLEHSLKALNLSLKAFKRKVPSLWEPVAPPQLIPNLKHLRRQIRYVHLNPCRNQLITDPLHWEFSTHWDYLNYTVDSISVPTLEELEFSSPNQFHRYVSADSTTQINGTPLPCHEIPDPEFPIVPLERVAELTKALTRKRDLDRGLFYTLAEAAGYQNKSQLARYLKIRPQSVSEFHNRGQTTPFPRDLARQLLLDFRIKSPAWLNSQEKPRSSPQIVGTD